jgi:predicted nucleic acid-binding protein
LALFYLDTSALVKLYVREPGTDKMLHLASREHNHRLAILIIAEVEFRSAVRRRKRSADLESSTANELIRRFENHLETRFLRQALSKPVLDTAKALIHDYALRAYDAVQLVGCLVLRMAEPTAEPAFVCSDRELLETAILLKLSTLDPPSS